MGPVFHSHSSQMPLYSVPPPFIPLFCLPLFPPPINDSFVWVCLPRWAGRPLHCQAPRLADSPETFLPRSLEFTSFGFYSLSLFLYLRLNLVLFFFSFLLTICLHSSFTVLVPAWHPCRWIFGIPPSLLLTTLSIVQHFFMKTSCLHAVRPPLLSHCVSPRPSEVDVFVSSWIVIL